MSSLNIPLFPVANRNRVEPGDTLEVHTLGTNFPGDLTGEQDWCVVTDESLTGKIYLDKLGGSARVRVHHNCPVGSFKVQSWVGDYDDIPYITTGHGITISVVDPDREIELTHPDGDGITLVPGSPYLDIRAECGGIPDTGLNTSNFLCSAFISGRGSTVPIAISVDNRGRGIYRVRFTNAIEEDTIPMFSSEPPERYASFILSGKESSFTLDGETIEIVDVRHGNSSPQSVRCIKIDPTDILGVPAWKVSLSPLASKIDTSELPSTTPWTVAVVVKRARPMDLASILGEENHTILSVTYGEAIVSSAVRVSRSIYLLPLRRTATISGNQILTSDTSRNLWIET